MVENTKDNGKMESNMALVFIGMPKEKSKEVNGTKERE
jgi:hypothetical protein